MKCSPSQQFFSKQYDVWVLLKNDHIDEVDGKIISAYFTGTAGLLGSRSHIADLLLFRIKAAVLKRLTHPTYTSVLASWKILTRKKK